MKTVLVCDDEFDLTSTLKAILEGDGYRAETCGDGRSALESLKRSPPDLVLIDVMMPACSGLEVLRAIRDTPQLGSLPVILMSVVPPSVKRADYQWQAFLQKPFTLESLRRTVHSLIGNANGTVPTGAGESGDDAAQR